MSTLLSNSDILDADLGLTASTLTALKTAEGDDYVAKSNEVISAVNKLAYQKIESMSFTDPFRKFNGRPITYGDTIENLWLDIPQGLRTDWKDLDDDPFTKQEVSNKRMYATINYQNAYGYTIRVQEMRRAVMDENGLSAIVDQIAKAVTTGMEVDTYQATIAMLNNKDIFAGGIESLAVSTLSEAEKAKAIARKIKDVVTDFALFSPNNNKAGVPNVTPRENCLLIIKQSLLNDIDFNFLAGVFNLSKVEIGTSIIPVRSFRTTNKEGTIVGDDIDFMILDTRGFELHEALKDGGGIYNPKKLYTNYYHHLWKIIAYKYWYNARAYKLA